MSILTKVKNMERPRSAAGNVSRSGKGAAQACVACGDIDSSVRQTAQAKKMGSLFSSSVQRAEPEEELQGKFPAQRQVKEEELQGKFPDSSKSGRNIGIPPGVQAKMEGALNTSLSDVKVHPNSDKATEVGALAYTQGTDIHVAPGQFSPDTTSGKKLLGHELTHVVQQSEGRVQPTGEVGGLPLNDNPALEHEADVIGAKAI
jgi:hypothetical protein